MFSVTDPRWYQIIILGSLLFYGLFVMDFGIALGQLLTILISAQLTQYLATRLLHLPRFEPRSALITSLSLCLLLRVENLWAAGLLTGLSISSKFILRVDGRHLFNPANLALVAGMLSGLGWVSPGQWGSAALFGFFLACAGLLVITRARRADAVLAFLVFYTVLLLGRAAWLGDPWSIPLHNLHNGAFLLFVFFMFSDPLTLPNRRGGRMLYALFTALTALFIQFGLYQPAGLIWALAVCAPFTALINRLLPGEAYQWRGA